MALELGIVSENSAVSPPEKNAEPNNRTNKKRIWPPITKCPLVTRYGDWSFVAG